MLAILAISCLFLKGIVDQVVGHFDTTQVPMDCLRVLLMSVGFRPKAEIPPRLNP